VSGQRSGAIIVLPSLCAEGTPVMARDLCVQWRKAGVEAAVVTLFDEPNEMAPDFEALGVPILRAHTARSGCGRYLAMVRFVAEAARELRPRGVLSMLFGWHAFIGLGAKLAGVPRVIAHVGNYPVGFEEPGFWKFQAEVLAGCPFTSRLVCCSEYVRDGILRYFPVPRRHTAVIYNGRDLEDVARRAALVRGTEGGRPLRIGMVARLEVHKDQDTLIAAAGILARRRPVELWLVGDGSRRAALEELARAQRGQAEVCFLGARRDVPEILGQLDVFAFSAKPDEGLGIALIEAMAARAPIVATDVGACREVLEHGALGRIVPYRDAAAMAGALEEVAAGGPEVEDRIERAARSARERFSTEAMAAGYAGELGLPMR